MKLGTVWPTTHFDASMDPRAIKRVLAASERWLPAPLRKVHPAELLGASKSLQATDPRDKFYGMLAIL
jgi:hypothetical protein